MINIKQLPKTIAEKIGDRTYLPDEIGRSDSSVLLFDDMVLKIEKTGVTSDREYRILQWLDGKLPVPQVIAFERADGYNYLLMTKLTGTMACDMTQDPQTIVKGLAAGLRMLWAIGITDCPCRMTVSEKLDEVKKRMDHTKKTDCEMMYTYLEAHLPEEDPVFSHGDYCLPNIFLKGEIPVGFLDLGQAGIADRWQDIYWCVWSMRYNFCEFFGIGTAEYDRLQDLLFEELGMEYDAEKLRWYQTLEELWEATE